MSNPFSLYNKFKHRNFIDVCFRPNKITLIERPDEENIYLMEGYWFNVNNNELIDSDIISVKESDAHKWRQLYGE